MRLNLPSTAIGKDYPSNGSIVDHAPSGTGYQLSMLGILGVTMAREEGFELNLLGLNFGIHDAVELATLIGRVLRREASPHILEQYDRLRRPLNVEYVQQQTVANKKRLEEKDPAARARNNEALRKTANDPAAHRAYLLRASLIDSVRKRAAAA